MKLRLRFAAVLFGLSAVGLLLAAADKWVVTQASMSKICYVQRETSRPLLGRVIATFDTKEEAIKARAEMLKTGDCQ
jgi:hypothetical protein